jgi:hypothetical protein
MLWIDMAQDMDQWGAVVYTVMNFRGEVIEWPHNWRLLKMGSVT